MKQHIVYLFTLMIISSCVNNSKSKYNFSFENLNKEGLPENVDFFSDCIYAKVADSTVQENGRYSLLIKSLESNCYGYCASSFSIPAKFAGKQIKLSGYIKTESVDNGYAGLWLRLEEENNVLQFDNMHNRGITGTNDWQLVEITLPYNSKKVSTIVLGGLIVGSGKAWFDNLSVSIDNTDISEAETISQNNRSIDTSNLIKVTSNISDSFLKSLDKSILKDICIIWGILKYHHPAVAKGNHNMDIELFNLFARLKKTSTNNQKRKIIELWVDSFGSVEDKYINVINPNELKIIDGLSITDEFKRKLQSIVISACGNQSHYYVCFKDAGNVQFNHELDYNHDLITNPALKLLSLFRYWNYIQYFYPYKNNINEEWGVILDKFIPIYLNIENRTQYVLMTMKLISTINDSHATINTRGGEIDSIKGIYTTPFLARYIENKLIVTGFYNDSLENQSQIKVGDELVKLGSSTFRELNEKYLQYTSGSNKSSKLRELVSSNGFLFRTNNPESNIQYMNKQNRYAVVKVKNLLIKEAAYYEKKKEINSQSGKKPFRVIEKNIGYIDVSRLTEKSLDTIKNVFANTKGLVIDMRYYPSIYMPFKFGEWLKDTISPFATYTTTNLNYPGIFHFNADIKNGAYIKDAYKGLVVVLVNEHTQSAGEFAVMALQSAKHVLVIGSQTSGADGDVSQIILPGGLKTKISGIGIFYPNGKSTQGEGIKIDKVVNPTVKSIQQHKDIQLEQAIRVLDGRKNN